MSSLFIGMNFFTWFACKKLQGRRAVDSHFMGDKEQHLVVPKLDNSLPLKKKPRPFPTRSMIRTSMTRYKQYVVTRQHRIQAACMKLVCSQNKSQKESFRHHTYELVLDTLFETRIHQVTERPDILLFRNLKGNQEYIHSNDIECETYSQFLWVNNLRERAEEERESSIQTIRNSHCNENIQVNCDASYFDSYKYYIFNILVYIFVI